jgi:hypothetical protein
MKQTAVEWLFAHLIPHLDWSKTEDRNKFRQLEQEALAMEKEHLMMAFNDGKVNSVLNKRNSEQYYNESYGRK